MFVFLSIFRRRFNSRSRSRSLSRSESRSPGRPSLKMYVDQSWTRKGTVIRWVFLREFIIFSQYFLLVRWCFYNFLRLLLWNHWLIHRICILYVNIFIYSILSSSSSVPIFHREKNIHDTGGFRKVFFGVKDSFCAQNHRFGTRNRDCMEHQVFPWIRFRIRGHIWIWDRENRPPQFQNAIPHMWTFHTLFGKKSMNIVTDRRCKK